MKADATRTHRRATISCHVVLLWGNAADSAHNFPVPSVSLSLSLSHHFGPSVLVSTASLCCVDSPLVVVKNARTVVLR